MVFSLLDNNYIFVLVLMGTWIILSLFDLPSCSPHDRVPLKEMKSDWHACLDNEVGFKVISPCFCSP
jgi:hypothetical protein